MPSALPKEGLGIRGPPFGAAPGRRLLPIIADGSSPGASNRRDDPNSRAANMSDEKRELLAKLRFELAFIEEGGYGRSVRTPHQPTSPFQDSLTCLNFGDPLRTHPCGECVLMQYVPESRRGEDVCGSRKLRFD